MASQLKAFLAAAGLEEYTDGEQDLKVHVASEPSIDHDVAELTEAEIEQTEIARDCDALVENQVAMEAYADLLRHALDNGGVNSQAAAFLRLGMERFETEYGLAEPLTPSVEAFGGSASQMRSTTVSLEAISETLKKSWETIKKALKALWEMLKDVYTKATGAAAKLENRAEELKRKAVALERGKAATGADGGKITIGSPGALFIDGQWAGQDLARVYGVVQYVSHVYPEKVLRYVADVTQGVNAYDPTWKESDAVPTLMKILNTDGLFDGFNGTAVSNSDTRFPVGTQAKRSETLPGDKALYISIPSDADNTMDQLRTLNSKLKVELLPVPGTKPAPQSHEVAVDSLSELIRQLATIQKGAASIRHGGRDATKIRKAVDDLIAAGDKLKERADKAELNSAQRTTVDALLRGMMAIQKLLGQAINGTLTYGVKTLNAQLAVIERQLATYKVPSA